MKTSYLFLLSFIFILGGWSHADAQILKKLKKRAAEAAEETIIRKVEEKTAEETEKTMDTILEAPGKKIRKKKRRNGKEVPNEESGEYDEEEYYNEETDLASLEVYSKFDFVAGDQLLFFDDFSEEFMGDFPSKWNTNGSGEIVSINDPTDKWFELKSGHSNYYIPDLPPLPEEYTIEFDLFATGLDQQTGSTTVMKIILSDNNGFKLGNYALAQFSFCQYDDIAMRVVSSTVGINNEIGADIREAVLNQPHISIAVNKRRFRLWINENKYIDIPRLLPADKLLTALKFELLYFKDGKERLFIKNLKVAEGGLDLRRQLIENGSISTNGILFNSGSTNLQPQSMGVIRQISQVLQQDANINLMIIGHTDADGDETLNLKLSERRATAVMEALVSVYGINPGRLEAAGKGEADPVADNNTTNGKAQNRRVEFIKI